jgi:hypothetical protein
MESASVMSSDQKKFEISSEHGRPAFAAAKRSAHFQCQQSLAALALRVGQLLVQVCCRVNRL